MDESHPRDLAEFHRRLDVRVRAGSKEPKWRPDHMAAEMQGFQERKARFDQLAPEMVTKVIRPRLAELASFFPNASLADERSSDRVGCWFGFCERFPASAKIELVVAHDPPLENVVFRCEASIFPSFQPFEPYEKLVVPITTIETGQIARWVEDRLLEFLDAYLRIDRGLEDFVDEVVNDPVCGMRIARADANATSDYHGHPYYFCSAGCRVAFVSDPTKYVRIKTL